MKFNGSIKEEMSGMTKCKLGIMFSVILSLFVLTACGDDTPDAGRGGDTESDDVLVVGSTPTGPPYTFMDEKTEEMKGIMIDIADELGENLDKDVVIEPMTFDTLIQSLKGDKIDVISAGMVITEERGEEINFTDEVFGFGEGLIVHEDNSDISSYDDLKGKNVGTQKGTIYHEMLEESGLPESVNVYESIGDMLQELSNGRLDAVVADEPVLIYLEEKNPNFAVKIIDDYDSQIVDGVGLGVAKDDDELLEDLNEAIQTLKDDGTLEEIYDEWNVDWDFNNED